jgi:hypothetical protein
MQKLLEAPTAKNKRHKISLTKAISWMLLSAGAVALSISIIYTSSILALIGLGLFFWGAVLTYIKTEEYIKKTLLDATALPSLETLNQILQELNYKGKAVYLPPKYFEDPESSKIYIAKQENSDLPTPEQIQKYENRLLARNTQSVSGIILTPPGIELTKLFEKTLETSFTKVDLGYLQQKMPKLFIEDLEIAENLQVEKAEHDKIQVKIINPIYKDLCKKASEFSHICGSIGCPICSAIACAIAKASGKLVTIEKTEYTEDGRIIEIEYKITE